MALLTTARPAPRRARSSARRLLALVAGGLFVLFVVPSVASAQAVDDSITDIDPIVNTQPVPAPPAPAAPTAPSAPGNASGPATVTVELPDVTGAPSQSVLIILVLTVLSVAPALLIMLSSFTRIAIVLSLTRQALGLQGVPPNQVIVGLALFLSLFVMGPTLSEINDEALQPLLAGEMDQGQAYEAAVTPIRTFMLGQTREDEIGMFLSFQDAERPDSPEDVSLTALIPAFILSELRTAFIIGFVVFIPFLVIDIIIASSLMSMGMMMLPPVMISLPFKLMLFVMVDGWDLVVRSLVTSFN